MGFDDYPWQANGTSRRKHMDDKQEGSGKNEVTYRRKGTDERHAGDTTM
jgi:hypothetical protein